MAKKMKILFLCTGNSCRSQMAEAWTRELKGDQFEVFSSGVEPKKVDLRAVKAMAEANIDISAQESKDIESLGDMEFDYVITLCDNARESCPFFPAKTRLLHKGFDDPPYLAKKTDSEEKAMSHYLRVRDEIMVFIESLPEALREKKEEGAELRESDGGEFSNPHRHDHSSSSHMVDGRETSGARLLITMAINLLIPAAQVVGGVFAHSMALISDAVHNFSDFTALLIAYFAFRLGKKGASPQNTFGYKRAEILGAVINVALLVAAAAFILYEAFDRLRHPQPVVGQIVIYLAGVGILGNGLSAWLLHRDSKHSLNVRGAFLHMVGDLLTSVLVLINGIVLVYRPWYWLDPLLSFLIVIFILKNCWTILKEATGILMNATPKSLDLEEVKKALQDIPGVCGVHYLHAWNVSSSSIAFSCHVEVTDQLVSKTEPLSERIRHELFHRFGIDHPILQFETVQCGNGGILCEVSCAGHQAGYPDRFYGGLSASVSPSEAEIPR